MKLPPDPVKSSSTANDAFSSAVQPNTLPPRQTGETLRPLRPSSRISISVPTSKRQEQQQAALIRSREVLGTSPQAALFNRNGRNEAGDSDRRRGADRVDGGAGIGAPGLPPAH